MAKSSSKKSLKGFLTWDNIAFIIILGSIVIYLFFQVVILKTPSPQVAVTTTSMTPTYEGFDLTESSLQPHQYYDILRGDLLIVQNIKPQVGDVAVFKAPNEVTPIVHRLVAERTLANGTQEFATKGDNNPSTDASLSFGNEFGWIPESSILGVVVFAIHHIGWFSLQLQNPLIRIFLIVATLGIIILTIYDSTSSKDKTTTEDKNLEKITKKRVFLKFKTRQFQIYRPKLFTLLLFGLLFTTYAGMGFVNYSTGHNTVQPSITNNQVINLRSNLNYPFENYSNIHFYNYEMNVSSSGFLNTVNKVVVRVVYNNATTSVTNPDYVWTIVYDYSGMKLVHPILVFNVPQSLTNTSIKATVDYSVYSSGLLASPVNSFSVNILVLA